VTFAFLAFIHFVGSSLTRIQTIGITALYLFAALSAAMSQAVYQQVMFRLNQNASTLLEGISLASPVLWLWGTKDGAPTPVKLALDLVEKHYAGENARRSKNKRLLPPVVSPWLFHTRKGDCYYDMERRKASGFQSVWQRSMKKALEETILEVRFTEHDLRAKVGSDLDSDQEAQRLLAHADAATTRKHYRRKGAKVVPARGVSLVEK
jgi:hypothetical protein